MLPTGLAMGYLSLSFDKGEEFYVSLFRTEVHQVSHLASRKCATRVAKSDLVVGMTLWTQVPDSRTVGCIGRTGSVSCVVSAGISLP